MPSSLLRALAIAVSSALILAACGGDNSQPPDAGDPPNEAILTVTRSGPASGTVSSSSGGIACGTTCSASFPVGSRVSLTAVLGLATGFTGWGGACSGTARTCTITVTADVTVTAAFEYEKYPVTIELSGSGTGAVRAPLDAIRCPGLCTTEVLYGSRLSLSAEPNATSEFVGWTVSSGGTACTDIGQCDTTITGPTVITATFASFNTLEVIRTGTGAGTVASAPAGIDCGADCSEQYPPEATVTLTATPAADSIFVGWSGSGCTGTGTCTIEFTGATLVSAEFRLRPVDLTVTRDGTGAGTVTSSPAGIDCGATCTATYDIGTAVTLTAAAAVGSTFAGWSGGGCSGTGTCTVTLAAATAVTATFTLNSYALSVTRSGAGSGTVTSSPGGINCGVTCSSTYSHGAMVTLTAAAAVGSTFAGWSGGGCSGTGTCTVTVTAATAVTATFTLDSYALSVIKAGAGDGTVTSSPAGIACGADCSEPYTYGTAVTLTATPATGATFAGWTGGGCSGTGTCTVTVAAATDVTATFTVSQYTLSVIKMGSGGGGVSSLPGGINCGGTCSASFAHGTVVQLTATPAMYSIFNGWNGGGCTGTGLCTITMTGDVTLGASFQRPTYTLTVAKAGIGNGTVTSSPSGINCGATCSQAVLSGSTVTLTATPVAGSTFVGWSGGCSGTGPCAVTVAADLTVTATFFKVALPILGVRTGSPPRRQE